jgi:hypothetical protein
MSARAYTVKINSLFLNEALWPRRNLSRVNIKRLVEALRCGRDLPPIIADRATKTVVDGFHRIKATEQFAGPDGEIAVEWRLYANEAVMFLDAARLNAGHGEPLTPIDQAFCLNRAEELKIDPLQIIDALNLSKPAIEEIRHGRFAVGPDGQCVILKRSIGHLAGSTLTPAQVAGNERVGGFPVREYVEQLIAFIEGGLLQEDGDSLLHVRLRHLHGLLSELLAGDALAESA